MRSSCIVACRRVYVCKCLPFSVKFCCKDSFFLIKLKNIPILFAFVLKNSYIANTFKTLTNHWDLRMVLMQVKTVVNDDDYLFLSTLSSLFKTKIV